MSAGADYGGGIPPLGPRTDSQNDFGSASRELFGSILISNATVALISYWLLTMHFILLSYFLLTSTLRSDYYLYCTYQK
jgi:hypothetical protein